MSRCRWRIIGRWEPEPEPLTTQEERDDMSRLQIIKVRGYNTVYDVFNQEGDFLGQVRMGVGGSCWYRLKKLRGFIFVGYRCSPVDPLYFLSIRELVKIYKQRNISYKTHIRY